METLEKTEYEPIAQTDDVLARLLPRAVADRRAQGASELVTTPVVATLVEFDLEDRPVIRSDRLLAGELLKARATVVLKRASLGSAVVVVCENGDARLPIVIGVVEQPARAPSPGLTAENPVVIHADDERYVVNAEREIVLRCGESSITLTRAGKVIIKGRYILSRSSGYNKIKGAAVDIN
jgi:hypothetical protein